MKAPMKLQNSPMAQRRLAPESAESAGGAGDDPPAVAEGVDGEVPEAEGMEDIWIVRRCGRGAATRCMMGGGQRGGSRRAQALGLLGRGSACRLSRHPGWEAPRVFKDNGFGAAR